MIDPVPTKAGQKPLRLRAGAELESLDRSTEVVTHNDVVLIIRGRIGLHHAKTLNSVDKSSSKSLLEARMRPRERPLNNSRLLVKAFTAIEQFANALAGLEFFFVLSITKIDTSGNDWRL